jgi:hypothetical protein
MNTLPSYDYKTVFLENKKLSDIEKENFEKNYEYVADCMALNIAQLALKYYVIELKNPYYIIQNKGTRSFYLSLDVTKSTECLKIVESTCGHLSPFNQWMKILSYKISSIKIKYIQESMKRFAIIVEKQLNMILCDYISYEKHNMLNFNITLENLDLTIYFGINDSIISTKSLTSTFLTKMIEYFKYNLISYDFKNLITEKEKYRSLFESDFELNYKTFVDQISLNITSTCLTKMIDYFKYNLIDFHSPLKFIVIFDITNIKNVRYLQKISDSNLPPFTSWLNYFSNVKIIQGYSKEYFEDRMRRVATVVENKIKELLFNYTSNPKHDIIKYDVKYDNQDISLSIDFWVPEHIPSDSKYIKNTKIINDDESWEYF